jgi:hypothetical protein
VASPRHRPPPRPTARGGPETGASGRSWSGPCGRAGPPASSLAPGCRIGLDVTPAPDPSGRQRCKRPWKRASPDVGDHSPLVPPHDRGRLRHARKGGHHLDDERVVDAGRLLEQAEAFISIAGTDLHDRIVQPADPPTVLLPHGGPGLAHVRMISVRPAGQRRGWFPPQDELSRTPTASPGAECPELRAPALRVPVAPVVRIFEGHHDEMPQPGSDHVVAAGTPIRLFAGGMAHVVAGHERPRRSVGSRRRRASPTCEARVAPIPPRHVYTPAALWTNAEAIRPSDAPTSRSSRFAPRTRKE